jgi:cytochrome c556
MLFPAPAGASERRQELQTMPKATGPGLRAAAVSLAAALALAPAATLAQDFDNQIAARQGQFKLMALNLGMLGGMARGNIDYDAATAELAARNLVAISQLDQSFHWPEGSDNMMLETTRAQPTIWDDMEDFGSKWAAFGTEAEDLAAVAGDGLEALRPAVGELGGTCQACHEAHRGPELE